MREKALTHLYGEKFQNGELLQTIGIYGWVEKGNNFLRCKQRDRFACGLPLNVFVHKVYFNICSCKRLSMRV